jgi:hypothetical protein
MGSDSARWVVNWITLGTICAHDILERVAYVSGGRRAHEIVELKKSR